MYQMTLMSLDYGYIRREYITASSEQEACRKLSVPSGYVLIQVLPINSNDDMPF